MRNLIVKARGHLIALGLVVVVLSAVFFGAWALGVGKKPVTAAVMVDEITITPEPSLTSTPTPAPPTATPRPTRTNTPTVTASPTVTRTPTRTRTPSPTPTVTNTPTKSLPTKVPAPTRTPIPTAIASVEDLLPAGYRLVFNVDPQIKEVDSQIGGVSFHAKHCTGYWDGGWLRSPVCQLQFPAGRYGYALEVGEVGKIRVRVIEGDPVVILAPVGLPTELKDGKGYLFGSVFSERVTLDRGPFKGESIDGWLNINVRPIPTSP